MSIEAWVTTPAGVWIAHLDRSPAKPFRNFAVSRVLNEPGAGMLEHHLDNALTQDGTLLADGNLVWMRYRGRTMVWVIEERAVVLDEREHASDWVRVTGRGALQLLGDRIVWPTAFSETALDPALWGQGNQWRRFINRAAGEMLWDLISESNARPGFAPIVRGTVQTTGADGWTQDLRFDNLLEVVEAVTAAHGDVEMDGLTFSYYNSLGTDRSATVIFEEGADLLRLERDQSDRDAATWIVGEGVGEGVTAKLAVAKDTTATRRREAYLDAKDVGNVPLLGVVTAAALAENGPRDTTSFDVSENRFEALTDYDLGDTVRAIAPSRQTDVTARVMAIYFIEKDDRVSVSLDLASLRVDPLLGLDERQRSTARSLSVKNRQPQGQLTPFPISGQGVFDTDDTLEVHFWLPDEMNFIVRCRVAIDFRAFKAPAKSASSSGTLTSDSGGGATSGASSASTTAAGSHTHVIGQFLDNSPGAYTTRRFSNGTGNFNLPFSAANDFVSDADGAGGHDHGMSHTHSTPNHQHNVAGHTHSLVFGIQPETYPGSHSVTLKIYELVGSTWTLRTTITTLTDDREELDLTQWVTGPGQWRLDLQSAGGQPNGGRLAAYVSGHALGPIQSAWLGLRLARCRTFAARSSPSTSAGRTTAGAARIPRTSASRRTAKRSMRPPGSLTYRAMPSVGPTSMANGSRRSPISARTTCASSIRWTAPISTTGARVRERSHRPSDRGPGPTSGHLPQRFGTSSGRRRGRSQLT